MQAGSAKVGCGRTQCDARYTYYVFCNYLGPNWSTKTPWTAGDTCAACPNKCKDNLCDCNGLVCANGGTKDIDACTCTCPPAYYGTDCRQERCPGLRCKNKGSINVATCKCTCYNDLYSGDVCDVLNCPFQEWKSCATYNKTVECPSIYTRMKCPYLCDLCAESERPTCEEDPKCYRSSAGCLYIGAPATPAQCSGFRGGSGLDSSSCKNDARFGSWTCESCTKYSNVKSDYCPWMCGYCPQDCKKWCLNGGTVDLATCSCNCRDLYTGDDCSVDKCPGVTCENGGTVEASTCKCVCNGPYSGATCSNKQCPFKEYGSCGTGTYYIESRCSSSSVSNKCPYLCNVCQESERMTCEQDPNCYKSSAGCYRFGSQATPEQCAGFRGGSGLDSSSCKNDARFGSWTCESCTKYSNVKSDYCPWMCGYCPQDCKQWCYNGGTVDLATCSCTCRDLYKRDDCSVDKCPGVTCENGGTVEASTCTCVCNGPYSGSTCNIKQCPFKESGSCGTGTYYIESRCSSSSVSNKCPYLCNVCQESERMTCEQDPNCYKSSAGCYRFGSQATSEQCAGFRGGSGLDSSSCKNDARFARWTCEDCTKYSNVKSDYCPWMCGYCPQDCKQWCYNGGTVDLATCSCSCRGLYLGDDCSQEKCPGVTCQNGGSIDAATCGCKCSGTFIGASCETQKCPGVTCQNGGSVSIDTCACVCPKPYVGTSCETKQCPHSQHPSCGTGTYYIDKYCWWGPVKESCLYMCGVCVESERPTCEEDPTCS